MDKELKAKWTAALRSGKYIQTEGALHKNGAFCCLGVLLDIRGGGEWEGEEFIVERSSDGEHDVCCLQDLGPLRSELKVSGDIEAKLIDMNDDEKKSFIEIADYIEKVL